MPPLTRPPASLDPNWDTSIVVQEVQDGQVKKEVELRVLADALRSSPYWNAFLKHTSPTAGMRGNNIHIEDTGVTCKAVEIVLRAMHHKYHLEKPACTQNGSDQTQQDLNISAFFPSELFKVDAHDVWGVMALVDFEIRDFTEDDKKSTVDYRGRVTTVILKTWDTIRHIGKFMINSQILEPWFLKFRETSLSTYTSQDDFEKILFPCWGFQDSVGWHETTKWLCRNSSVGQIAEFSPFVYGSKAQASEDFFEYLHLPKSVINAVRITRSSLRNEVSDVIWSLVRGTGGFLSTSRCSCRVVACYNYLSALQKPKILDPELSRGKTVNEIIESLKKIDYIEPEGACRGCCNSSIQANVKVAQTIGQRFGGMDLECSRYERLNDDQLRKLRRSYREPEEATIPKPQENNPGFSENGGWGSLGSLTVEDSGGYYSPGHDW